LEVEVSAISALRGDLHVFLLGEVALGGDADRVRPAASRPDGSLRVFHCGDRLRLAPARITAAAIGFFAPVTVIAKMAELVDRLEREAAPSATSVSTSARARFPL